uniref:Importin N-terminal domain-containing protein n=1 Tax=Corethron hystrix TaxID=216773 RepID=A0A6U5ELX6_9STRA|mmetsp:Transcript_18274/g.41712  ORF Transcript_18274/g.41712 Transcript_18274/m.41712 type:complete len:1018 (+) Transcript_18274:437-3490(+)
MDAQSLAQVETLCDTLYVGSSNTSRTDAQQRLLALQSSSDYIPQCQYVLDHSTNHYARLVASNSLTELITNHWNKFTVQDRIVIRDYVLNYIAQHGPSQQEFVNISLIKLLCRITKLGWFDDPAHRELCDEQVPKFLQHGLDHCILGLKILNRLVDELNIPLTGRTLTQHRKTSVSFRDVCLLKIFQLGLTTLRQLQTRAITGNAQQEAAIGDQSLGLCVRCLNFDFIGTNPDESAEDVGTIQVPASWRPIVQDPSTLELLFEFYSSTEPPCSSRAMEAVILLASCRRSLFPSDKDRAAFLEIIMRSIREIMASRAGLQHQQNYHQFCRLLGRIKANYQLSELVKAEGYIEWLGLASSFTVTSMENWQWSTNSIHYLLALWGRLVAAVPYVRADTGAKGHPEALEKEVISVIQCYVDSMLGSVATVAASEGALDDPLDDDGSLREQLDRLPIICRFQYQPIGSLLLNRFDPAISQYQELLNIVSSQGGRGSDDIMRRIEVLEGKLTWLTFIVGAIVGGHSWSSAHLSDGEETIDAGLSRRVMQLAQFVDYRLSSTGGQAKCSQKLELAILFYFQSFRRVYMFMWDQVTGSDSISEAVVTVVGMGTLKLDSGLNTKQKVYERMFEHMGMGDHTTVANLIITKVANNLKFWPNEEDIVSKTLELFLEMASGYSSSKLLLTLETIHYLMSHHSAEHFPFLTIHKNARHRTTYYTILTRLMLTSGGEEKLGTFQKFVEPICTVLSQLSSLDAAGLRTAQVKKLLIGVLRDLRGVTSSLHNRKTYGTLFDILYPAYFPFFTKVAEVWHDEPEVIVSLLKFLEEFCYNKANRVNFDQNSPNGILLFRMISDVICSYGRKLLTHSVVKDNSIYKIRYKGMSLALNVLNSCLSGNYVCFGVFPLYNDPVLENALSVSLEMILSVPLDDVIAYPKLSKAHYAFIEILFRGNISTVLGADTNVFLQIMHVVHEGLQTNDGTLCAQAATTVDHLATFYFENVGKDKPAMHKLNTVWLQYLKTIYPFIS